MTGDLGSWTRWEKEWAWLRGGPASSGAFAGTAPAAAAPRRRWGRAGAARLAGLGNRQLAICVHYHMC